MACDICGTFLTTLNKHTHHITPRSMGGKDDKDNLIDICSGCHDLLHRVAYTMMSRKASPSKVRDTVTMILGNDDRAFNKLVKYASQVRDAAIFEKTNKEQDDSRMLSISSSLTAKHKKLMVLFCKDNKLSQENFVRHAVIEILKKAYPGLV